MSARGFTYIELVVTVAIVALLAAAALPMLEVTMKRSRELELREALRDIRRALDAYKRAYDDGHVSRQANATGYPPALEMLVEGVEDAKSAEPRRIYFLRRLPRDPFARDPGMSAAQSWGKRSYASPHDAPLEGTDVFDVYSRSESAGLNGVPYREW